MVETSNQESLITPARARLVRFSETRSGLDARALLLDAQAPAHAGLLWELAGLDRPHAAVHAMWTGPEISVPIAGNEVLPGRAIDAMPQENATSFPAGGDIALVCARQGTWKDGPPFDLIDIGLFYADGGRLLMPMGWIMASICARIVPEDREAAAAACRTIRRNGACDLRLSRCD